jgi:hypothetical protein
METLETIIGSLIEIELTDQQNFLKIKETLTRIGIPSKIEKTLYQSCHILQKRGKYYIVHFKELFKLDGKSSSFTLDDQRNRDSIAVMLERWNLLNVLSEENVDFDAKADALKIIPFHDKKNWTLVAKYTIGKKK